MIVRKEELNDFLAGSSRRGDQFRDGSAATFGGSLAFRSGAEPSNGEAARVSDLDA